MNIFQTARNELFWLKDRLNRNVIKNNIADIGNILENYNSPQSEVRRNQLLRDLLAHATATTPYYQSLKNTSSLADFPVVNKNLLRDNSHLFKSNVFNAKDTVDLETSGSTGTPLIITLDKRKQQRNSADTIYFLEKANYKVGRALFYIRKWTPPIRKPWLQAFIQNIRMIEVSDLSDQYLARLIKSLKRNQSEKTFLSYVSALTQICKYLDSIQSGPIHSNVTSVIAASEKLTSYCKQSMEKYFQAPVVSRYSNTENGILAQQFPGGSTNFNINWASYILEIFDLEEDKPVEYGVLGRIVVTDLFNYAMPIIRYDIGDLGIMELDENGIPVLKALEGRRMDMIFDTKGNMTSPAIVWDLDNFQGIKQFQLVQTGETAYTIRLNVNGDFHSESQIEHIYKKHLGADAQITIEKTGEIPILASGKRKLVANTYKSL